MFSQTGGTEPRTLARSQLSRVPARTPARWGSVSGKSLVAPPSLAAGWPASNQRDSPAACSRLLVFGRIQKGFHHHGGNWERRPALAHPVRRLGRQRSRQQSCSRVLLRAMLRDGWNHAGCAAGSARLPGRPATAPARQGPPPVRGQSAAPAPHHSAYQCR